VYQDDVTWQIALGRFLHPLYFELRGHIYTPALVGFLALIFIGISVYIILRLFAIKNKLLIVLTSGVLTVNTTITLINATYIHDIDIYALSLLLSVASVYICRNVKYGMLLGAPLILCSLALYQAFLQVAVFLYMLLAVVDLLQNKDARQVFKDGLRAIGSLLLGLISYYITLKVVLRLTGVALRNGYNGLTEVGNYDGIQSVISAIKTTYVNFFSFFLEPVTFHSRITRILNVSLALICLALIIVLARRRKLQFKSILLLIVLLCLVPFGANVVCFISQGMEHDLMTYSFNLCYVFALVLFIEAGLLKGNCNVRQVQGKGIDQLEGGRNVAILPLLVICCQ
jgi:hypothetical protein